MATNTSETNGAAKVVGTAVAAMLLGGLGGAAQALRERRDESAEDEHDEQQPEQPEPEDRRQDEPDADDEPAEPEARVAEDEEDATPPEETADDEPEQPEPAKAREEEHGVGSQEAASIVDVARSQLAALLGSEPERVSGLHRSNGGWTVELEVVEVARIPPSTDVLATYELGLDGDRNIVGLTRTRRYRRSQIDDGS